MTELDKDFEMLESITLPPAYVSRLGASSLDKLVQRMEDEQKAEENLEQPEEQNPPPGLGSESNGRTQENAEGETQLTPLERALMERFGENK